MKQGIHLEYRPVVFRDRPAGFAFLTRSTATPTATIDCEDGQTCPVVDVDVSAASHRSGPGAHGSWTARAASSGSAGATPSSPTSASRQESQ